MIEELDILYKEKVRLSSIVNGYEESIFNDIKMLSAFGSILVFWEPILDKITIGDIVSTGSLFLGFLGINIAVTLVGLANLSKLSAMNYYIDEVQILEKEIRNKLNYNDSHTIESFKGVENWKSKWKQHQLKIARPFFVLITIVAIFLPTTILYQNCEIAYCSCSIHYPLFYFVLSVILAVLYYKTSVVAHGKP